MAGEPAVFVVSTKNEKSVFSNGDFNLRVSVSVTAIPSLVLAEGNSAVSTSVVSNTAESKAVFGAVLLCFITTDDDSLVEIPTKRMLLNCKVLFGHWLHLLYKKNEKC